MFAGQQSLGFVAYEKSNNHKSILAWPHLGESRGNRDPHEVDAHDQLIEEVTREI
jgi:hypothetical protein